MDIPRFCPTLLLLLISCAAHTRTLTLEFEAAKPAFREATREYRAIWAKEGSRITQALERHSGTTIPDPVVRVVVFEGMSHSGRRGEPLRIRASYPESVKRATLVHELLHRYLDEVAGLGACYPEIHDVMSVMLLEIWSELWGREFAMEQAQVESARSERYERSWARALGLSRNERREEIAGISSCLPDR